MKKILVLFICLACFSTVVSANGAEEANTDAKTLVVNVHGYTPDVPQAVGPKLRMARVIADEFEELNPGVTIEFRPSVGEANQLASNLKTALVAGTAPDITYVQITEFWTDVNKGWFVPMDEYLAKPNPYVPNVEKWQDLFGPDLSMRYRAPDDNLYTVAIDLVDTGVFYNKRIFEEVGVVVPTTWAEFVDVLEKIEAHGTYVPFSYQVGLLADWTTCVIREALQKDQLEQINLDGDNRVSIEEFSRAYKQGMFQSSNPTMQETFRIIKEWEEYWPKGWATMTMTDATRLFATQEAAMNWDASWAMRTMRYDPAITFEWGIFPLPPITKETTPLSLGVTVPSVGGIGEQLAVTESAIKGDKVDLAMDFLMYWTAPQNAGRLLDERLVYLPNIQGVIPSPGLEPFAKALENWKNYWWDGRLGSEVYGKMTNEVWGPYLLNKATLAETTVKRDELLSSNIERLIVEQGWDFK